MRKVIGIVGEGPTDYMVIKEVKTYDSMINLRRETKAVDAL